MALDRRDKGMYIVEQEVRKFPGVCMLAQLVFAGTWAGLVDPVANVETKGYCKHSWRQMDQQR